MSRTKYGWVILVLWLLVVGFTLGYFIRKPQTQVVTESTTEYVYVKQANFMTREEVNDCIMQYRKRGTMDTVVAFYARFFPARVRMRTMRPFNDKGDRILRVLYKRAMANQWTAEEF